MDRDADRDAHVRAARRRQALDALVFEQDREAMLVQQLEEVLAEVEGARLDADLFEQMSPDDGRLVRRALGQDADLDAELEKDAEPGSDGFEFSLDFDDDDDAEAVETEEDDVEEEIARLEGEIESSRRVQAALATYLELLSAPPGRVTEPT